MLASRAVKPCGLLLLALALVAACDSGAPPPAPPRAQTEASAPGLEWIERLTGGARAEEPLPLVVAMHGLGDRPESFGEIFAGFDAKARIVLLRAPDRWGNGYSWFPFRATDGDELRARGIAVSTERVAATLTTLAARRPTLGKPVVTGFSQGGMLSFALAARYPERVKAAVPIGGVLPPPLWPALDGGKQSARVIALHGEDDELVPVGPARAGVEALSARGFDARLESFPGVGHGIPATLRARYFELLRTELERP